MTEKPARSKTPLPFLTPGSGAIFLSGAALVALACGCSIRKGPSVPWAKAVQVRPVLQARAAGDEVASVAAPELKFEVPSFTTVLVPARNGPVRPHVNAPSSTNGGADAEKMQAPTIASQLTPQETVVAQQETNQSLSTAERNLASVRGKTLNAAQTDLVSKIKGFLKDAREAAQAGDWKRARSLAKKAQVLSEELMGSF
jgi:hypothetical protein